MTLGRPIVRPISRGMQRQLSRGSEGAFTKEQVRSLAGVSTGVVPGVRNLAGTGNPVLGVDYGFFTGAVLISYRRALTINQRSDVSGLAGVTGDGSLANPYTFDLRSWDAPNDTGAGPGSGNGPNLIWNDTSADPFWIRVRNSKIATQQLAVVNGFEINCGAGSGLILENVTIDGTGMASTQVYFLHTSGIIWFKRTRLSQLRSYFYKKVGASAICLVDDVMFDNGLGGFGSPYGPYFWNTVAGGSLAVQRTTIDPQEIGQFFRPQADWAVTIDKLLWRPSRAIGSDTAGDGFLRTDTANIDVPWHAGFTITESRLYTGLTPSFGALIGIGSGAGGQSIWNLLARHCELIAPGTSWSGGRLVALGLANNVDTEYTKNHLWQWCRFIKPQATGVVAGNEAWQYWSPSDTIAEYCWVDSCGEDAFEITKPLRGCRVRYCGAGGWANGAPAASYAGGNVVDFFGGASVHTLSTDCEAHHIWGSCRSDAGVIDSCHNVRMHDFDVDNVAGGFVQNPPAANIRLQARGVGAFNAGNIVELPLSAPNISFASKPCYLTRDPSVTTTVLATGTSTMFTLTNPAGFSAGQFINVVLANGSIHYTTIVSVVASAVTLTDPMPSATANGNAVEAVSAYNAGPCVWPEWAFGDTYFSRTGTHGGVDSI